jgi:hypothetical protein
MGLEVVNGSGRISLDLRSLRAVVRFGYWAVRIIATSMAVRIKINIRSDFSDGLESKLLTKVCRRRKRYDIYVRPFPRFGFSGARLLLVYFKNRPAGLPFLLKVAPLRKAISEHAATKVLA